MNTKYPFTCLLVCGIIFSAVTQNVYLQGYVYYKNGRPLREASVQLIDKSPQTTTDSSGIFHLQGRSVRVTSSRIPHAPAARLTIASRRITFTVMEPGSPVTIDLFEASGRKCATLANGTFSKGAFSVPFLYNAFTDKLYLVRARIGTFTHTLRMPLMKNASGMFVASGRNSLQTSTRLSEVAKNHQDTLVVQTPDGAVQMVPVDTINSFKPLFIVFDNDDIGGNITDDALGGFPVVTPVMQQTCSRYCYSRTISKTVPLQPEFSPEVFTYTTEGTDSIFCINPVARSSRATISVSLDGAPWYLSSWYITSSNYITSAVYSCTLSTSNTAKTFSTTVTAHDDGSSKTYNLTMTRN